MKHDAGGSWIGTTSSLAALVAGLLLGFLSYETQSWGLQTLGTFAQPLGLLWLNALQMTVVPLVIANLIVAVVRAGSATEVGWLGALTFALFVVFLLSAGGVSALSLPPVLAYFTVDEGSVSALSVLSQQAQDVIAASDVKPSFALWLTDLVPRNVFEALTDGDLLPLLVFSVLFGLALSRTEPDNRQIALGFFLAVAEAMKVLVHWILYVTPLGVFALALTLAASMGGAAAGIVVQYLVLICGLLAAAVLLLYPVTVLLGGVSLRPFALGVLPAQVVALGTRSSLASLPALIEGAEQRLDIDPEVSRLTLPLAVSTFKLNQPFSSVCKVLFIAHLFGIELGTMQIFTFVLTIMIMSFSSLGVPLGGGAMRTLPAYLAAGIPVEALILFEAVEAIPDIFKTLLNVTGDMSIAIIVNRIKRRVFGVVALPT
jgi:Na+/H+-dicarboxylate symporter